jgi:Glycosyl transferases group 1
MKFTDAVRAFQRRLRLRWRGDVDVLREKVDRLYHGLHESLDNQSSTLNLRLDRVVSDLNDRLDQLQRGLRESLDNQSTASNLRLDQLTHDLSQLIERLDSLYRGLHESLDNQSAASNLRLDRLTSDLNDRLDQLRPSLRDSLDNQSAASNLRLDRLTSDLNDRLDQLRCDLRESLDNQSAASNLRLDQIVQAFDRHSRKLKSRIEALISRPISTSAHSAQPVNKDPTLRSSTDGDAEKERPRRIAAERERGRTFFLCRTTHEHDRIIMENMGEYLTSLEVPWKLVEFETPGDRPQLRQCLDNAIGVMGLNSQLDHCWLGEETFLDVATEHNVPVVHWILDHPSARWPEFGHATPSNSLFLFGSGYCEAYFRRYVFSGARTAWTAGVGPNWRSRLAELSRASFLQRNILCLIALNLRRLGGTLEDASTLRHALEPALRDAVEDSIERARHDLAGPLEAHLAAALAARGRELPSDQFHRCFQIVEDTRAIEHRLRIFEVAARFPVLIQTDHAPVSLQCAPRPTVRTDAVATSMAGTIARMKSCRAVLSANFANDVVHDRTTNALNAGCIAIVEDTPIHRQLFEHGKNALLFRYDDESLAECLDLVCHRPDRACEIAKAGFALRDHPAIRFGGFNNAFDLTGEWIRSRDSLE